VLNIIEVNANGNFAERVTALNDLLLSVRMKKLKERGRSVWQKPQSKALDVVLAKDGDFLQRLGKHKTVTTVVLPWQLNDSSPTAWSSLNDTSNVLVQRYYEWTADSALLSWTKTRGQENGAYKIKKSTGKINYTAGVRPLSLRSTFVAGKRYMSNRTLPNGGYSYTLLYMHIHRDAIVTKNGDVASGNLKLVLPTCAHDYKPTLRLGRSIPLYDELFVLNQRCGRAYFHQMVNVVPRIAVYVNFLKNNPKIQILASETSGRLVQLLKIIGLPKPRLVTGVTRAKIVYQPKSSGCGGGNVPGSQYLSQLYRDYIERHLSPGPRNKLVLIRRSRSRKFTRQKEIENVLRRAARDFNLTFTLFADNPVPSLKNTMRIFYSAVMIVGPVGAGEANMLFSQPGTFIIEGVCNPPYVNLCFQGVSHVLGHHWHGILLRGGCHKRVDISPSSVNDAVCNYLRLRNGT